MMSTQRANTLGESARKSLKKAASIMHPWIFLWFTLSGIFFGFLVFYQYRDLLVEENRLELLRSSGVTANAIVIDRQIDPVYRRDPDGRRIETKYYDITYQFNALQQSYENTARTSYKTFDSVEIGDPIEIVYIEDDPTISKIKGEEERTLRSIRRGLLPCILMISLGVYCAWKLGIKLLLDKTGKLAPGIIIDKWTTKRFYRRYVAYRFMSAIEMKQEVNQQGYDQFHVNQAIMVRYLPGYPTISRIALSESQRKAEKEAAKNVRKVLLYILVAILLGSLVCLGTLFLFSINH